MTTTETPTETSTETPVVEQVAADEVEPGAADQADATPEPEPEPADESKSEAEPAAATPARRSVLRTVTRLPVLLVAAAIGLAGLGGWFTLEARDLRSSPAADNQALVDTGATAEVSAAVTSSLNRVFSYSFEDPEATEQAADAVLRGPALETYNQLFAQVREMAPEQQVVLTTRVVSSAVQSLHGDQATLLVFLDQSATRASDDTTSAAAAQLSVTAKREGETWVIIDMEPR